MFGLAKGTKPTAVSAETAKKLLDDKSLKAILVDVRTPEEFKQAHIPGAKLIPDYDLQDRAATDLPNKETPIVVYCLSGGRSGGAARWLAKSGYSNVYDLGSIHNWTYPLKKG